MYPPGLIQRRFDELMDWDEEPELEEVRLMDEDEAIERMEEGPEYEELAEMRLLDELKETEESIRLAFLDRIPREDSPTEPLLHHVNMNEFHHGRVIKHCTRCKHDQILHFGGRCHGSRGNCNCVQFMEEL